MIYRIAAILTILAITILYSIYEKSSLEKELVSDTKIDSVLSVVPMVNFETMTGEEFSIEQLYQNEKPSLVIVHFWGTWCAPCEAELPELLSIIKRYEGQPKVHFLLVAANDEARKVQKHLDEKKVVTHQTVKWLLDNKNIYRDAFGTTRVPETYVFSSDKALLRKFIGPQQWSKSQYLQTFDELLQISNTRL